MFRRILQLTPGRAGSQNSESDSPAALGNLDVNDDESSEGFICPLCMKSHCSAEELFKHYEAAHESGNGSSRSGEAHLLSKSDGMLLLQQEVQDLQASLKEEKWYSEELKKELEKVRMQLKQDSTSHGMSTAASTELKSLQLQLEDSLTENFNIKQAKDLFEQKAAQLTTEIVELKAKYDKEKGAYAAAEERITSLHKDLQEEMNLVQDLKTELLQRPAVDDVAVLKKELIQIQTLMDNATFEREKESEKLKEECKQLKTENANIQITIKQLKEELAKGPQEVAIYIQELQKHQSSMNDLRQKNQNLTEKLLKQELDYSQLEEKQYQEAVNQKNLKASLRQKDLDSQQLQARFSATESSLQSVQIELGEKGKVGHKLKEELLEVELKYQHLKDNFKQLQQQKEEKEQQSLLLQGEIKQLHSKLLETERQLGEAHGRVKEQRLLSGEKLKDKEQQVADLHLKISRAEEQLAETIASSTEIQHQLDKARQHHQEQQTFQQSTTAKLRETQNDLEQVLRQIGDKDQTIQNLEALLQNSREHISLLEKEREELYVKIQAGEGETAVLNQLHEKNRTLQEQVTQLTEKLKNQSESHKQNHENLHDHLQEQKALLRASEDRAYSLETSVHELNGRVTESKEKLAQLDAQIKAKTELLLSAEAAKAAQRADFQNHLDAAQNALQDNQQELNKVSHQLQQVMAELHDKQEHCSHVEGSLKEYKEKHLTIEKKAEELKGHIKKLEADILNIKASREQVQNELQQKTQQCSDLNCRVTELSKQLEIEKEIVTSNILELKTKAKCLEQAQEKFTKQEAEKDALKQDCQKLSLDAMMQQKELSAKLQVLVADVQKLRLEKDSLSKELADTKDRLSSATESLQEAHNVLETEKQKGKAALEERVELESELQQQVTLLSMELAKEKENISALQRVNENSKESLNRLQSALYGKESELSALQQDLKSLEEKLAVAQEDLVTSRNEISNQIKLIKELKTRNSSLDQDAIKKDEQLKEQEKTLNAQQEEKTLKEEELKNEKAKGTELWELKTRLEEDMSKQSKYLNTLKEDYEKKMNSFKDAKQLLIQQKLELQSKTDHLCSALEQAKMNQQFIKEQLMKTEEEWKRECAQLEAKQSIEVKEKEEQMKKHEEAEAKLVLQITALNENFATLKKEWQSSQRRVDELEKQTDDLRGEIAVLEATVQNNQDDRRALLERCLKSEGEIEKLQSKVTELRRKLDDATAAMQELGRENQSLQIKHTQALSRKWAEDTEVQNCMECGKGFSVTVRKHHCRQCGNIYCAECSARNALIPSSKKPVRVCNSCFQDLQG